MTIDNVFFLTGGMTIGIWIALAIILIKNVRYNRDQRNK